MKKLFALLIAGSMTLTALVGCGTKEVAKEATTEQTTTEAAPGTLKAEGEADERGWKAVVELTVAEDNKITAVDFDYVNGDGAKKSEDEEYNKKMSEVTGITAADAMTQLEAKLVETQDIEKVDTVAGATGTTDDFKAMVTKALGK